MSRKRRNHSPEFKSKVALAALKGDQTLSELSQRYGINSKLIVKWKKQLLEQSSEVFASGKGIAPDITYIPMDKGFSYLTVIMG